MSRPRLLLFDLYSGGHHRQYLEMIARAWVAGPEPGLLQIAAPEELWADHADFADWVARQASDRVRTIRIALPEPLREGDMGLRDVLRNDFAHGRALGEVLRGMGDEPPDHLVCMYFDHIQASLALRRIPGLNPSTRISGVYFRPSFHYPEEPAPTRLRKRLLLRAALSNPAVHRVLCLDPFAVRQLHDPRVVWLPDGFDPVPASTAPLVVQARWSIPEGNRVLLFFGVISARKGIFEVLHALRHLAHPERTSLVIAGRIPEAERVAVSAAIERARDQSPIHIAIDDRYAEDAEIQDFFRASDAALVAYRKHTGSSNVLIRAAAEAVPVVGPNYGLMARLIRERGLGLTVDPADPVALAAAMDRVLGGIMDRGAGWRPDGLDPESARRFARENTAERCTGTLFAEVLG